MEYSSNFNFFIKNQIYVISSNKNKHYKFVSRLDGSIFKIIDGLKNLSNDDIMQECMLIHKDIKDTSPLK